MQVYLCSVAVTLSTCIECFLYALQTPSSKPHRGLMLLPEERRLRRRATNRTSAHRIREQRESEYEQLRQQVLESF